MELSHDFAGAFSACFCGRRIVEISQRLVERMGVEGGEVFGWTHTNTLHTTRHAPGPGLDRPPTNSLLTTSTTGWDLRFFPMATAGRRKSDILCYLSSTQAPPCRPHSNTTAGRRPIKSGSGYSSRCSCCCCPCVCLPSLVYGGCAWGEREKRGLAAAYHHEAAREVRKVSQSPSSRRTNKDVYVCNHVRHCPMQN